jgi:TorA maturation chaperone TorD
MPVEEVGRLAVAAGSLLLNEPDTALQDSLRKAGYHVPAKKPLQQIFYDRLGIPQSGLYLPPYEHVFRKRYRENSTWHFPPARHDGGAQVENIYRSLGFRRLEIPVNPMLKGSHIPGDHLGFMLVFVGSALEGIATGESENAVFVPTISRFVEAHLDGWVEEFCTLLPVGETAGYLEALAGAVQDAVGLVRSCVTQYQEMAPA